MIYQPLRFFLMIGSIPFALGFVLGVRWLMLFFSGTPKAHVPSLILVEMLILIGFQLWMFSLVADLMAANRKLMEELQLRLRRLDADSPKKVRF